MPIRDAIAADAAAIADIYNHYIEHTDVTFEETAVTANMADLTRLHTEMTIGTPKTKFYALK